MHTNSINNEFEKACDGEINLKEILEYLSFFKDKITLVIME